MDRKQLFRLVLRDGWPASPDGGSDGGVRRQRRPPRRRLPDQQWAAWLGGAIGAGLAIMGGAAGIAGSADRG